jgi:hypothetical protein
MEIWTGIMAITTYSGEIMSQAGFSSSKAAWLAGLCNTFGIVGTAAAVGLIKISTHVVVLTSWKIPVIDRLGRVKSLMCGYAIQGVVLVFSAAFTKVSADASSPSRAEAFGTATTCMVFIFLFA